MKVLLQNIKELLQIEEVPRLKVAGAEMASLPAIKDAFLLINDEVIEDFGPMADMSRISFDNELLIEIDCRNRLVLPAWCDAHTHLVFAAAREQEFVDRIKGLTYQEIADRGGGILNSARRLHEMPEDDLYADALERINQVMRFGTGAIEIKSGYGLNTEDELKMLRVIRRLRQTTSMHIRATFLGAHAVPEKYKGDRSGYVDLIINEMIPAVAEEGLAEFVDVFCETGYFTPSETGRIVQSAADHGLLAKLHANEMGFSGGVQVGVAHQALSVDHLEYVGDQEIDLLLNSHTMPTLLPGASFFLKMPYAPARKMIDAGLPVALASDFNPGSSPSGNMNFITSLACLYMNMLPEEAINAATINGAYAMGISDRLGSIGRGKVANLLITREITDISSIPYSFGSNPIDSLILNGELQSFLS